MESFKSNGKLLLTGEYVVLDGALALAIPTKYSQRLNVEKMIQKVSFGKATTSRALCGLRAHLTLMIQVN